MADAGKVLGKDAATAPLDEPGCCGCNAERDEAVTANC